MISWQDVLLVIYITTLLSRFNAHPGMESVTLSRQTWNNKIIGRQFPIIYNDNDDKCIKVRQKVISSVIPE